MKINKNDENKRPIDEKAESSFLWWKEKFVFIRKAEIKSWKAIFAIAFISGAIAAIAWAVSIKIQTSSEASNAASLSVTPSSYKLSVGSIFSVNVVLNTNGNNIVATRADVFYDANKFSLLGWDTKNSVFSTDNACMYDNKPCQIVENDPTNGKISIVQGKPTPGVNTSNGLVATLTFQAISPVKNGKIGLTFNGAGNYSDSDVILDNGIGTDILYSVGSSNINVSPAKGGKK